MIRGSQHRRMWYSLATAAVLAVLAASVSTPSAQSGHLHLNPVVEALAQGRHVFGVSTADLSLANAIALAGNPNLDYVYLDMEHNPLRFEEMKHFLAFITAGDKTVIIKRGRLGSSAVFALFHPYGRRQGTLWIVHPRSTSVSMLLTTTSRRSAGRDLVRTMRPPAQGFERSRAAGIRAPSLLLLGRARGRCRSTRLCPLIRGTDFCRYRDVEVCEADAIAQVRVSVFTGQSAISR